jgi:uncharacterized membrane protein
MVLELKVPHGADIQALRPLIPVFVSYVLSFAYLAIYWNNHHHMLQIVDSVSGRVLWANMHLLFWLSLIPFSTAWLGENHSATWPCALYGVTLLMPAVAWRILQGAIITHEGPGSRLAAALGSDFKGRISMIVYILGIGLSFASSWAAIACYVLVALLWLVPDQRFAAKAEEH